MSILSNINTMPDKGLSSNVPFNFDQLVSSLPDMICVVDIQWKVLSFNQAALHFIDDQHQIRLQKGLNLLEFRDNDLVKYWKPVFDKVYLQKRKVYYTDRKRYGLKEFYLQVHASPILNDKSEVVSIGFIVQDVTRLKKIEKQLQMQNEELQKVNEELDRFVYSASHDLRAPLTSLLGLLNLTKVTQDETEKQQCLSMMENSIQKMDKFIKDIISHSKNIRLEPLPEKIDFQEIVQEILLHNSFLPKNKPELHKIVNVLQDKSFFSDIMRVKTILNNLITNAINYSDLQKQDPFIQINISVASDKAVVEISDNGIGIGEEHLEKIFDMFYRANQESNGSGLGLYMVKETVKKLGGKISVVSSAGKGSVFTVVLPNLFQEPLND
ncbi:MAG TPA: hypothetical protein DCM08_11830 [Microscillaceae bacterium]|nr:hypothetical protein [Microscillaceae bacterium]